jgi:hypothetical protein
MPLFPRWRRSGTGKNRAAENPEEQVKALRAALVACRAVAVREKHWLMAAVAALVLLVGIVLVVNREPLQRAVESLLPLPSAETPAQPLDAAYAAYRNRDDETALRLSRPLAEQGNARAQTLLGLIYHRGFHGGSATQKNEGEATKWFLRAAEQGDASAQLHLGIMYSEGRAVPQNFAEAAKWYRLAADQGNAQAQFSLGLFYVRGEGVPASNVLAHKWFNLAAAHFTASESRDRQAAAKNRDAVAFKMTREEIAEAQKLAREWRPSARRQNGS